MGAIERMGPGMASFCRGALLGLAVLTSGLMTSYASQSGVLGASLAGVGPYLDSIFAPSPPVRSIALPAPEPDPFLALQRTARDPLEEDIFRRLFEGDQAARLLELPEFAAVADHLPPQPPLLRARAVYVADSDTGEVLFSRNALAPLPVASLSKLMGALVYADSGASPDEALTISQEDKDYYQVTRSRLRVGRSFAARDLLYHSLLPSDNRATVALMRQSLLSPERFGDAMNRRAQAIGLTQAHFVEPTGLDAENTASARDVVLMLEAALRHPVVGDVVRTHEHYFMQVDRPIMMGGRSSNRLSHDPAWNVIGSKTGFTYAAGSCLVMRFQLDDNGRNISMAILGAPGEYGRYPAARALKDYLEATARRTRL